MREFAGAVVDPFEGEFRGVVAVDGDRIVEVRRDDAAGDEARILPGFVDLHVYDPEPLLEHGVTGYLLATRDLFAPSDPCCLGLHLEGPFLNPEAAGAIPVDELRPVDLASLPEWLDSGSIRMMTVSPELPGGLAAIALLAERGTVAALGHTHANAATTRAAVNAGARFATHLWNAVAPVRARATGPVPELLLDERVTIGLIADGRHLHPRVEELTVRVAGPDRIALTSDLVAPPGHTPEGSLLGGTQVGAELVARMSRFGLPEAVRMASYVPARVLGLTDRGRLAPGYRADLAILDSHLRAVETVVAGESVWTVRYPRDE